MVQTILNFLTFASQAEILRVWGVIMLGLSALAAYLEKRALRRIESLQTGWVPWFAISFIAMILGAGFIAMSLKTATP